jgi:hypothetical protein
MVSHKQHFAIIPGGKKMNCMHNQSSWLPWNRVTWFDDRHEYTNLNNIKIDSQLRLLNIPSLAQHEHHIQNINMDKNN